jgi:DNA-binding MarR family transcriptional regulator
MVKDDEKDREERRKAAKEFVNLTHVETKKQEIDSAELSGLMAVKKNYDAEVTAKFNLTAEDRSILSSFQKKRMMFERLWIIVNQARTQMGLTPIKQTDIKQKLDDLVEAGFLDHEEVEYEQKKNDVYILTEKGEEEIQ